MKHLTIGAFLERIVVERANNDLCFKRTGTDLLEIGPRGQRNNNIIFLASTIVQTSLTTVYHFLKERESNVPYSLAFCSRLCVCCLPHALQIMEKFLTTLPKDAHTAMKTTARDRLRSYPKGTLHEDDGLLFCSTCNVVLDHTRKSSIDKHLESATHVQKSRSSETTGKQKTLKTSLECKTSAQVFPCITQFYSITHF